MYAVKLKIGPMFALLKVKNWSKFFVFENRVLPEEKRKLKKKHKKHCKFESWLNFAKLRKILGPVFNFDLDQFLALNFSFCFFG